MEQAAAAGRPALLGKMNLNDTQVKSLQKLAAAHDAWLSALEQLPAARARFHAAEAEVKAHPAPEARLATRHHASGSRWTPGSRKPPTRSRRPRRRPPTPRSTTCPASGRSRPPTSTSRACCTVLRNFVSVQEGSILKKNNFKEYNRRMDAYDKGLNGGEGLPGLRQKYKGREKDLEAIITAYQDWSNGANAWTTRRTWFA